MLRTLQLLAVLSAVLLSACGQAIVGRDAATPTDGVTMDTLSTDASGDASPGRDIPEVFVDTAVYCTGDVCCPAGRPVACGTSCVDLMTDGDNCGSCGTSCGAGAFCAGGQCTCSMPQMYCPTQGCIDTTVDPSNCGACGMMCPATAVCTAGVCVIPCATGMHRCAGTCVPDTAVTSCGSLCTPCVTPALGTASCVAGSCQFTCPSGYHPCGLTCAMNTDLATCGTACDPCPMPTHGSAVCLPTGCGATCESGYHACGTTCADNTAVTSCGSACNPCPIPVNATSVCDAGICGFVCQSGYHVCGGVCSDGNNPLGCGLGCVVCPVPTNGTATCPSGTCGFTCATGYHACGSTCAGNTAVASCGSSCTPCPVPTHGSATCTAGACGYACDRGYASSGGGCIQLPRPIAPWNLATMTARRPTVRWSLPTGAGASTVDFCVDPACATVLTSIPATGTSGTATVDLPMGTVFWRIHETAAGLSSPVWQFTVTPRTGTVVAAWGTGTDVNADGFADVAGGAPYDPSPGPRAYVYLGSSTGVQVSTPTAIDAPDSPSNFALTMSSAGDVDGDGYSDLIVSAPNYMGSTGRAYVFAGGSGGTVTAPLTTLTGAAMMAGFGSAVAGVGDVDGDGYGDVVVGAPTDGPAGKVYVYPGSATGTVSTATVSITGPDGAAGMFGGSVAGAGDVNADGYADVIVGADGVRGQGSAYIFLGSATGLVSTPQITLPGPDGGLFGWSVAGVGDVNGDGYPDVAVGALIANGNMGTVYVYPGGAMGVGAMPMVTYSGPDGTGDQFGAVVQPAGDVNGDGYADIVVCEPLYMGNEGRAYVFLGGTTPSTVAASTLVGPAMTSSYFGIAAGAGRDVNGDGYPDTLVSGHWAASFAGLLYVYPGSATGVRTTPTVVMGPDPGGRWGFSLALRQAGVRSRTRL